MQDRTKDAVAAGGLRMIPPRALVAVLRGNLPQLALPRQCALMANAQACELRPGRRIMAFCARALSLSHFSKEKKMFKFDMTIAALAIFLVTGMASAQQPAGTPPTA